MLVVMRRLDCLADLVVPGLDLLDLASLMALGLSYGVAGLVTEVRDVWPLVLVKVLQQTLTDTAVTDGPADIENLELAIRRLVAAIVDSDKARV